MRDAGWYFYGSSTYIQIIFAGILPPFWYNMVSGILPGAMGDSGQTPSVFSLILSAFWISSSLISLHQPACGGRELWQLQPWSPGGIRQSAAVLAYEENKFDILPANRKTSETESACEESVQHGNSGYMGLQYSSLQEEALSARVRGNSPKPPHCRSLRDGCQQIDGDFCMSLIRSARYGYF